MKSGVVEHPKTIRLANYLSISISHAVGILNCLWDFTAHYAPKGDVGRWGDGEIAAKCYWTNDPAHLIAALVNSRWLDESEESRLIVHDWAEHAPEWLRVKLTRKGDRFASGKEAASTKISKEERSKIKDKKSSAQCAHTVPETAHNSKKMCCLVGKGREGSGVESASAAPGSLEVADATPRHANAFMLANKIATRAGGLTTTRINELSANISKQMEALGDEPVAAAVGWWAEFGPVRHPGVWAKIVSASEPFSEGRIQQANRHITEAKLEQNGNYNNTVSSPGAAVKSEQSDANFLVALASNELRAISRRSSVSAVVLTPIVRDLLESHGQATVLSSLSLLLDDDGAMDTLSANPTAFAGLLNEKAGIAPELDFLGEETT